MKQVVIHQDIDSEFWTPEKCYIVESSNSADDPDASIARARVEPGITTRWHRLNGVVERYFILEGNGLVEVGEMSPEQVNPGDVVLIPGSCRQRITNIGSGDLVFLAICTPRFSQEAYEDVEQE